MNEPRHDLKVWPEFFDDVASGRKTFELRRDDRSFDVGDTLLLREWSPVGGIAGGYYTGREVLRNVTYVLRNAPSFGLRPGFAILGLH